MCTKCVFKEHKLFYIHYHKEQKVQQKFVMENIWK